MKGGRVSFNEMENDGALREAYAAIQQWLSETPLDALRQKRLEAEALFKRIGITFAVYGEGGDPDRLIPFDLIPRVFSVAEWDLIDRGVKQRAAALNAFVGDVYGEKAIFKAGVVPGAILEGNDAYLQQMQGFTPPQGVYTHIVGIDLVRTGPEEFYVLEDNARTPSGVSYMLENRETMRRLFPDLFGSGTVRPVDGYPDLLRRTLTEVAPAGAPDPPCIVVLTPGHFNSAYYEHSFLADEMGVQLVEGSDLVVEDGAVFLRTTRGLEKVDVIYRRIDDSFLDPRAFRPDSALGVPGLMDAYFKGQVTIVNAPGTGVCDDKAIYCYLPEITRFYLGEDMILPNVPTWRCAEPDALAHVLDHITDLVVKEVHGSGGYGMLVGPAATKAEIEAYKTRLIADPKAFIAQPTLALSTCPTLVDSGIAPRHVDFRPYALVGREVRLTPGGLTRVAMREGSLVVNSSQGGGVKDTWVLAP
ncbi:MAG: circularly permuted type 2 ATP-grasp protein [Pseudomonadota bacterium]